MGGSLVGVWAKFDRAANHLDALNNEIAAYRRSRPYNLIRQPDVDVARYVARIKPPPVEIQILIGDAIYNMRSALDHLAWELVLENGGKPVIGARNSTRFPVLYPHHKREANVVGGVSAAALRHVRRIQPYNGTVPDETPLGVLDDLCNIDKHRHLYVVGAYASEFRVSGPTRDAGRAVGYLENGDMFDLPPEFTEIDLYDEGTLQVTLKETAPMHLRPANILLADTYTFFRDYIATVARDCFA